MRLSALLIAFFTVTLNPALALATSGISSYLPCIPQPNAHTCILLWTTNSGQPLNIASPVPQTASAYIYSPKCIGWGRTALNGFGNEVNILAWGLSRKRLLRIKMEKVGGKDFGTPRWTYGGRSYGVERCKCQGAYGGGRERVDSCACTFDCVPFSMER
jgi:hypothetical protein